MDLVQFFLIGVFVVVGLSAQIGLAENNILGRIAVPILVGGGLILGHILVFVFQIIDSGVWEWSLLGGALASVLFLAILVLKSFFAPVVASFILSYQTYVLFEYGELRLIPIFDAALALLFSDPSNGLRWTYISILLIYSIIATIGDLALLD